MKERKRCIQERPGKGNDVRAVKLIRLITNYKRLMRVRLQVAVQLRHAAL